MHIIVCFLELKMPLSMPSIKHPWKINEQLQAPPRLEHVQGSEISRNANKPLSWSIFPRTFGETAMALMSGAFITIHNTVGFARGRPIYTGNII